MGGWGVERGERKTGREGDRQTDSQSGREKAMLWLRESAGAGFSLSAVESTVRETGEGARADVCVCVLS